MRALNSQFDDRKSVGNVPQRLRYSRDMKVTANKTSPMRTRIMVAGSGTAPATIGVLGVDS